MKRIFASSIAALAIAWAPACDKKDKEEAPAAAEQAKAEEGAKAEEAAPAEEAKAEEPAGGEAKPAEEAPAAEEAKAEEAEPAEEAPAAEEAKAEEAEGGDYIRAIIDHADSSKGLVTVDFKKFEVVKANVDFENLDSAEALFEVHIASLSSGIDKRDDHLKSADFFDTDSFGKASVHVHKVAKGEEEDTYTAHAHVDMHGVKKELPVTFKVVEKQADGTHVIESEVKGLARADWSVGDVPEKSGAAETFDFQLRLSIKSTEGAAAE